MGIISSVMEYFTLAPGVDMDNEEHCVQVAQQFEGMGKAIRAMLEAHRAQGGTGNTPIDPSLRDQLLATLREMGIDGLPETEEISKKELGEEMIVSRFRAHGSGELCTSDDCHKIDFTISERVYITGLGVYGTRCEDGERNIYVELFNAKWGKIVAEGHLKVSCTGDIKIYQVRFKSPVLVRPGEIYTASAKFDNSHPYPTFYGTGGTRLVKEGTVKFQFLKTDRENKSDTGIRKGQIPQVLFRRFADDS